MNIQSNEILKISTFQSVFNAAMNANATTVGGIIDLTSKYNTVLGNSTTVNSTVKTAPRQWAQLFSFFISAYSSGTFLPILEGCGNDTDGITTLAAAQTYFATISNPAVNTTNAVPAAQLITVTEYEPAAPNFLNNIIGQNIIDYTTATSGNVLNTLSQAISQATAVNTTTTNGTGVAEFKFAFLPSEYRYLRFSMNASGVSGGAGATMQVISTRITTTN